MFPHRERRLRLIRSFPDTIDALLVTRLVNLRYLAGFSGSNGALLLGGDLEPTLAVDGRYTVQAATEAPDLPLLEARPVAAALVAHARDHGVRRLGVEAGHVTLALAASLRAVAGEVELIPIDPIVERLRAIKDTTEVEVLRRACAITDAAFADVVAEVGPGVTERDVARRLETAIREHGGDGVAFDSIVAFGSHSAIPHHQPATRELAVGDLVKIDFGAKYDGYHADMTRTLVMGPASDWQRELHAAVHRVQDDCRTACVVGVVPSELDARAGAAITAMGYGVAHGLGHGVGLEIHEDPFLTPGSVGGPLTESMTVTIEPGIYLPGRGGVRIEDTVLVTTNGPVLLTTSPRELIELG